MIYLTYNDSPSGIYNSQVIDVVNYLNTISDKKTKLIAFISVRNFFLNRKKIKTRCTHAKVYPMFPKASNWRINIYTLALIMLFNKRENIMARGPFATNLALRIKKIGFCKKVIFDARGAYYAELTEYNVIESQKIKDTIQQLEHNVIHKSDFRLAVSNALVNYWMKNYNYTKKEHVIIPCTLSNDFSDTFPLEETLAAKKTNLGYRPEDIIFIYSGSSAGWQSFNLVDEMMCDYLKQPNTKLIILSNHFDSSLKVNILFKEKITVLFVEPDKVKDYLYISDYGILYREQSITNKVASPVKFAEYLSCGLKVIISDNLGDYSDFVKQENITIINENILRVQYQEKIRIHKLSISNFKKDMYYKNYETILCQ